MKLKFNFNITLVVIIAGLALFIYLQNGCSRNLKKTELVKDTTEVTLNLPKKVGTLGTVTPKPVTDTIIKTEYIYIPVESKPDTKLLEKYKLELDSLKKEAMFAKAVTKHSYLQTFNNKDLSVTMSAYTTGTLDKLSIMSYTIPEQTLTGTSITSSLVVKKYHLAAGLELGIPTKWDTPVLFKANLMLDNKNNMRYLVGIDNERRLWTGLYLTIF